MTTDFRALCAELLDEVVARPLILDRELITRARAALADEPAAGEPASVTGQPSDEDLWNTADLVFQANSWPTDAIRYARAVLARWGNPAPQPPAEGEVGELVAWLRGQDGGIGRRAIYSRIADLLQRLSPPQPVPVSERLPGPEDCDEDGRCWWGLGGKWALLGIRQAQVLRYTHCLPAHALPLPEVK